MLKPRRRRDVRLGVLAKGWLESVAPGPGVDNKNSRMSCTVVEVSKRGLRLAEVSQAVSDQTILQLLVDIDGQSDPFILNGVSCWCKADAKTENSFQVGWSLYDAQHSDIKRWQELCSYLQP